jgi:glycosyltransferase involved in cell wall biosynthesis
LIPSYNRKTYISETIESVLTQIYDSVELIIVDDGSTDGSFEFLRELAEVGSIQLFSHPNRENLGQAASINLGLKHARGDYIAVLDSDDKFAADKLEVQVAYLEANPEVGMVYGQGQAIDADGNFLFKIPDDKHVEPGDPNRLLLDCYMALPGGALVRKSVLDKVGYFEESFRASQDHDMVIRLAESAPFAYLPGIVFYYRKHGDSISRKGLERRWRIGFEILKRAAARYPYKRSIIRKRRALLNFRMAQVYWNKQSYTQAVVALVKAGAGDPVRAVGVLLGREKIR